MRRHWDTAQLSRLLCSRACQLFVVNPLAWLHHCADSCCVQGLGDATLPAQTFVQQGLLALSLRALAAADLHLR